MTTEKSPLPSRVGPKGRILAMLAVTFALAAAVAGLAVNVYLGMMAEFGVNNYGVWSHGLLESMIVLVFGMPIVGAASAALTPAGRVAIAAIVAGVAGIASGIIAVHVRPLAMYPDTFFVPVTPSSLAVLAFPSALFLVTYVVVWVRTHPQPLPLVSALDAQALVCGRCGSPTTLWGGKCPTCGAQFSEIPPVPREPPSPPDGPGVIPKP